MNVHLAYGKDGLNVLLPKDADITIVEPQFVPALPDEDAAMRDALRNPIDSAPLSARVSPGDTVAVVFSDLTRPQPRERMLPVLLDELTRAGVAGGDIVLINALGTHRPNSAAELRVMLGDAVVDGGYRIIQHDATDKRTMAHLGTSSYGHEVWINRRYLDADVKILTGFIEPHIFAGFSGGPKAVLPGVAGMEIILDNHSGPMLSADTATWGVTEGNMIWEEMLQVAQMTHPDLLFNVALNRDKDIVGVFAGELAAAHRAGIEQVRRAAMAPVEHPFDVVVTTNSGYPLDINLYQSVKGISAAAQVVRRGGAILIASECWDGVPEFGNYKTFLQEATSPQALLDRVLAPGFRMHDQWEAFLHAKLCLHADVYVYAGGLSDDDIRMAMMTPCRNIEAALPALLAEYGPRLCVLPEGPMTIPFVRDH